MSNSLRTKTSLDLPFTPPSLSSRMTTQTSNFFLPKSSFFQQNPILKKQSTFYSNEFSVRRGKNSMHMHPNVINPDFNSTLNKEIIEEKNTREHVSFTNRPINSSDIKYRSKNTKKLTFELNQNKFSSIPKSLSKAEEFNNFNEIIRAKTNYEINLTIKEKDPQPIIRSNKKSNTMIDFHSKPIKHQNSNLATPRSPSITTKKPVKYKTEHPFLKKIVKIDNPKFEIKIDFLNQNDLHKNYKNFLFAQSILIFIKSQCKLPKEISLNLPKFIEISKDTYTLILQIFPFVRQAIRQLKNRVEFNEAFNEIEMKCHQAKNIALTLKTLLLHAKLVLLFQDVYKAIILYKNCKKLATNCQMYKCLISCYKGLGRCFQKLQQYKLALSYFAKMLQCSWKIKDNDHEILAYDLIGMQYYYMGELEKSKLYHQKMVEGELEPESSNLRRLAIENFLKKKNHKNDINFNSEHPFSQFTENLLDSSDESFELPNPSGKRNNSEPCIKKHQKGHLTGKNLLAMVQKSRKENMIGSIKSTKQFKRLLSKNICLGIKKKVFNNGTENQERVLISHLSPNRDLKRYHLFKPTGVRNINFYNANEYLYEHDEFVVLVKVKGKLKGYAEKLLLTLNKLKLIFSKV